MLHNDDKIEEEINEHDDIVYEESSEEEDELNLKDKLKDLREKLKVCSKEKQEYLTGWQKERADFVNFKTEEDRRRDELGRYAREKTIRDFLPVLDSFDMAFVNKEAWEKVDKNWRIGVEYIYAQLLGILGEYGVKQIGELGAVFNPELHQSIESIETEEQDKDNTIEAVIQRGYMMNDKIVRPARVNVYVLKK